MTLKGKLILNAAVVFTGIVLLVGVSLFGAIDTRQSIEQLARQSSPLQTQTLELMQRLEKVSSDLLRLGLVKDRTDAEKISIEVQNNLAAITQTATEIEKLGNKQLGLDIKGLKSLHEQVKTTVTRRLEDIQSFQVEATRVNEGLAAIDQSASQVGKGAAELNLTAGHAAEDARNIMAQSTNAIKKLLVLQTRYKAMELLFSDLDAIKSK